MDNLVENVSTSFPMKKSTLLIIIILCFSTFLKAQWQEPSRCSFKTPKNKKVLERFEKEVQKIIKKRRGAEEEIQWRIPVVFHIVHNGETIGEGANVTAEQVYSQLEVLNEDFNLQNADTANLNPDFRSLAGSIGITFVLARLSPEGEILEEPGIHRYQSKIRAFNRENIDQEAKVHTIWDPSNYLNIWVTSPLSGFLGTAQFPAETNLPELEGERDTPNTEGVAISYTTLGRFPENPYDTPYNQGRTLTHELGHWLGLYHTWGPGNGGCSVDDYCEDTPVVSNPNYPCLESPVSSCGNVRMHENFMEYTEDACMSIFTKNQKERMLAAMELGRFRSILNNSLAAPDTAITVSIAQSNKRVCAGSTIEFNAVVDAIEVDVNESTFQWFFEGAILNTSNVKRPSITYVNTGTFDVQVIVNNGTLSDTTILKNAVTVFDSQLAANYPDSVSANFDNGVFPPENWLLEGTAWERSGIGKASDYSVYAPNYYQNLKGKEGKLRTPIIQVQGNSLTEVSFEYAYSTWRNSSASDTLSVYYRTDCDTVFQLLWQQSGSILAQNKEFQNEFRPFQNSLWEHVSIPLNTSEMSTIEVMWEVKGGFGNNLHLDNLLVKPFTGVIPNYQASEEWICTGESILFQDLSKSFSQDTLRREWYFDGGSPNYSTDESVKVTYANLGVYNVRLVVRRADGEIKEILNVKQVKVTESNPALNAIVEDFEAQFFLDWNTLQGNWELENTGAFEESNRSISTKVTGSVLSTSLTTEHTNWVNVQFDYAASGALFNEKLSLSYSNDCGRTFTQFWSKEGTNLNTFNSDLRELPNFLEWKSESLFIPSEGNQANLIFKIDFESNSQTHLFLDNISITPAKGIKANFISDASTICENGVIAFENLSKIIEDGESIENIQWEFEGGTPETSAESFPNITYSSSGDFDVNLIVQSQNYTDTLIYEDFISVIDLTTLQGSLAENFEQSFQFENERWQANPAKAWQITRTTGGYGRSFTSLIANNEYFGKDNLRARVTTEPVNMGNRSSFELTFDYAYAQQAALPSDTLCILLSLDCGTSYREKVCFSGEALKTTDSNRNDFIPSSSEWDTKKISVDTIHQTGQAAVLSVAFENRSAANNSLFIDNVKVTPFSFEVPLAEFTHSLIEKDTIFILEDTVRFIDLSMNKPRAWLWEIVGPRNYSFASQNPEIVFEFPGVYSVQLKASNPAGKNILLKESFLKIESRIPLSFDQNTENIFEVFPNPSTGIIEVIGLEQEVEVKVFNVTGTLVYVSRIDKNTTRINLEKQPKGLYILELRNNENLFRQRVIIH